MKLPWLALGAIIAGVVVIVIQVIIREIRFAMPSPKGMERGKGSGGTSHDTDVDSADSGTDNGSFD